MAKRTNRVVLVVKTTPALTEEQIMSIIDSLRGTCGSLKMEIEERLGSGIGIEVLHRKLLDTIDENIFNCEVCGWWCDNDEMSHDQGVCEECSPSEEDEEDEDLYEDRMNYPTTDEDYYRDEPEDF